MGADNQQERLDASWIVGFTDGEGCFHISINRIPGMKLGWQVLPEFRIVQHEKDEFVLHKIKDYFGFGDVRVNRTDQHGTRKDFKIFSEVIEMMKNKEHLTSEGLEKIAHLISGMNRKPRSKYLESSETIRLTQR
jgi:hypothetical protein